MQALPAIARMVFVGAVAASTSCAFYRVAPKAGDVSRLQSASTVEVPTKVHLRDGGVVLFPKGFGVSGGALVGAGEQYDFSRQSRAPVGTVRLDDVAALEHYEEDLRLIPSLFTSAFAAGTGLALFKAVFGSCPTVYSVDGDRTLQAELFSHSISRRFQADDVDRLEGVLLRDGGYRVQLANEALETHYIDSLALEVIDHPAGTRAVPSPEGEIVIYRGDLPFRATSRTGDDATALLAKRDDVAYRTDPGLLRQLTQGVTEDWVELTVALPPEAHGAEPVLAMRLRNTLMTTTLFYDVMLKSQGLGALQWMGAESTDPIYAWRLRRWFNQNYGFRVQAWDGRRFVTAANLPPTGPIAWADLAVKLPAVAEPRMRLRIAFLPDNWMVDEIRVGVDTAASGSGMTVWPAGAGGGLTSAVTPLRDSDANYLVTSPGESHALFFPATAPAPGSERTLFLRSRGFYVEWLRHDWIADSGRARPAAPFVPGDEAVLRTAQVWLEGKDELERRFIETKIPLAGQAP